ncbi:MAG: hypothetical protein ACOVNU_02805 [Candidatus Kapaibacteriota bacterium]
MKINNQRCKEIEAEAKRRADLWLLHSTFEEMSCGGSFMRFCMSLGLRGYPFRKKDWMIKTDFNVFLTDEEFKSTQFDEIIVKLYIHSGGYLPF